MGDNTETLELFDDEAQMKQIIDMLDQLPDRATNKAIAGIVYNTMRSYFSTKEADPEKFIIDGLGTMISVMGLMCVDAKRAGFLDDEDFEHVAQGVSKLGLLIAATKMKRMRDNGEEVDPSILSSFSGGLIH